MYTFESEHYISYICKVKYTKRLRRKSQISKVLHLWQVRKSKKKFLSANLQIWDLRNLFVDRPPLVLLSLNFAGWCLIIIDSSLVVY